MKEPVKNQAAVALGKLKKGKKEKPSEVKRQSNLINIEKALRSRGLKIKDKPE